MILRRVLCDGKVNCAFASSFCEKDRLIEYVKNQEKHHENKSYKDELIELLNEHEIEFYEKYLF